MIGFGATSATLTRTELVTPVTCPVIKKEAAVKVADVLIPAACFTAAIGER